MSFWILPGLGRGMRAVWISTAIVLLLLASRLFFMPDGPWEQDEAIFAAGVLDFNVVRHRPHPPGFPGWIAIGKVLHLIFGDPLFALRVASSVASVLTVVVLARLLVPIAGERPALLTALLYAATPVVWAHAPRAFTTTPALACAVMAAALLRDQRLPGWALLGVAATIRPQLAPELAVVAALGFGMSRRRLALGITIAVAVVAVAYGVTALDAGASYWKSVSSHVSRHGRDLAGGRELDQLGIVRGVGGPIPAAAIAIATAIGLVAALRRDRKVAAFLAALLGVTAWMVLGKHHPGFPRYAVALVLAATPCVAVAMRALPRAEVLLGACIPVAVYGSLPALVAMKEHALPPVAALRRVSAPTQLVYSHGSFAFARYHAWSRGLEIPVNDVRGLDRIPRLQRGVYALEGRKVHFLPGATVCVETFERFPDAARPLSQDRFLSARLARDPILLGAGAHPPESNEAGDRFAWLSGTTQLHVPGPSTTLVLQLRVPKNRADQRVITSLAPETRLSAGAHTLRLPLSDCEDGCVVDLRFPDARPAETDRRRLSLRLEAAWSEGPGARAPHHRWSPGDLHSLRPNGVQMEGAFNPETFSGGRRGAWTGPHFHATFAAGPGTLSVKLARPPHTPGDVVFKTDADDKAVTVGREITVVDLRVEGRDGASWLDIEAPTFVPAEVNEGSKDRRDLGVILFEVEFTPKDDGCGMN